MVESTCSFSFFDWLRNLENQQKVFKGALKRVFWRAASHGKNVLNVNVWFFVGENVKIRTPRWTTGMNSRTVIPQKWKRWVASDALFRRSVWWEVQSHWAVWKSWPLAEQVRLTTSRCGVCDCCTVSFGLKFTRIEFKNWNNVTTVVSSIWRFVQICI